LHYEEGVDGVAEKLREAEENVEKLPENNFKFHKR
jgi:hypothetical protein